MLPFILKSVSFLIIRSHMITFGKINPIQSIIFKFFMELYSLPAREYKLKEILKTPFHRAFREFQ